MSRLIWSQPALLDVQRIYRFLAVKNSDAAKRAIKTLRQGVKALGQQPGIGRPIEDLPDEFREWLIDFGDSGYVMRYRIDGDVACGLHYENASASNRGLPGLDQGSSRSGRPCENPSPSRPSYSR